ncbi:GPW/gp25 family protein [uncultured Algoriphagus sp.]|uniref:GPW/gp25 family protein n=1 Tax=uncultured Algoriphagus sp. TaxID=417365 RepID=UPI0030ED9491|tara:strand:+ start:27905 stop:28321 length:417 start_codon:yes stop_codon:yes gene_type:complete
MEKINQSFLGRGWSFPPQFDNEGAKTRMLQDEKDIQSSLEILLSTKRGERVMRSDYGCNLHELTFEPLITTFKTYIKDLIRTAILYHEPRIEVEKIELNDTGELEGRILITITYKVRTTNSRFNFVFPFYKTEGTELK